MGGTMTWGGLDVHARSTHAAAGGSLAGAVRRGPWWAAPPAAPRPRLSEVDDLDGRASPLAVAAALRSADQRPRVRRLAGGRRRAVLAQGAGRAQALATRHRRAMVADRRQAESVSRDRHADRV